MKTAIISVLIIKDGLRKVQILQLSNHLLYCLFINVKYFSFFLAPTELDSLRESSREGLRERAQERA